MIITRYSSDKCLFYYVTLRSSYFLQWESKMRNVCYMASITCMLYHISSYTKLSFLSQSDAKLKLFFKTSFIWALYHFYTPPFNLMLSSKKNKSIFNSENILLPIVLCPICDSLASHSRGNSTSQFSLHLSQVVQFLLFCIVIIEVTSFFTQMYLLSIFLSRFMHMFN